MAESPEAAGASAEEDLDNDLAGDKDEDELFSEPPSLHLPNPWIDDPNPQSKSYPGIRKRLRKFQNRRRRMHRRGETWPYRLYADEPSQILFFEFRGYGPPPDDIGNSGDIYIDLTPYPRPLLYVCHGEKDWRCVNWSSNSNVVEFDIHVHPLLKGRYLWGTASSGFMWFTPASIRYEDLYRHTDTVNYDGMIAKAMRWDFGDDPKGPDNVRRREAEESRRKALQDEWLEQHKGWTMSPEEVRREGERKKEKERYAEESRIWRERKLLRDRDRPRHDGLIEGQRPTSPIDGHLEAHLEPVPIEDLSHLPKPAGRTGPRKRHSLSPPRGDSVEGLARTSIKKPWLETFSPDLQHGSPASLRSARPESERANSISLVKTPPVRGPQHAGNVTQHTPIPPVLAPSLKRKRHNSHVLSEDGFRGDDEGASESSLPNQKSIKGVLSTLKFKKLAKSQENVVLKTTPPRSSQRVTTSTPPPSPVPLRHAPVSPSQLSSSLHSNLSPISSSVETQKRKRTNPLDDVGSFSGDEQGASELLLPTKKPKRGVRSKSSITGSAKPQTDSSGVDEPAKRSSLPKKQPNSLFPPGSGRTVEEPSVDDHRVDETWLSMLAKSDGGEGGTSGLQRPAIRQRKITPEGKPDHGSFDGGEMENENAGLTDEGGTWDKNEDLSGQSNGGESKTGQVQRDIVGAPGREYAGPVGRETPCSPVGNHEEETEAEGAVQDDASEDIGGTHTYAYRETPGVTRGQMSGETLSWLGGSQKSESEAEEVIQNHGDEDEESADELYEGSNTENGGLDAEGAWDEARSSSQGSHEEEIETDDVLHDNMYKNGGILADRESSGGSWASDSVQNLLGTSHEGENETGDLVDENLEENRQAIHDTWDEGERAKSEFTSGDDLSSQNQNLSEATTREEAENLDIQSVQVAAPSVEFRGSASASQSQQDPGGITDVEAMHEMAQKAADVHKFLSRMQNISADRQTWKERANQLFRELKETQEAHHAAEGELVPLQSALDRAQIELHDMAAQIRLLEDLVEFQREKEAQSLEDHRNLQQRYEQVEAQNTQAERELALERAKVRGHREEVKDLHSTLENAYNELYEALDERWLLEQTLQSQKDKEAQDLKLFKDLQQRYQQLEAKHSQAVQQLALERGEVSAKLEKHSLLLRAVMEQRDLAHAEVQEHKNKETRHLEDLNNMKTQLERALEDKAKGDEARAAAERKLTLIKDAFSA